MMALVRRIRGLFRAPAPTLEFDLDELDIWRLPHPPAWWHNKPLRDFLTVSHRVISIPAAEAEAARRFGPSAPTKSTIQRYWQRLDELLGCKAAEYTPPRIPDLPAPGLPTSVAMARAAVEGLSDGQRVAMAREFIAGIGDPNCAFALMNLGSLCSQIGGGLMKQTFEREAG